MCCWYTKPPVSSFIHSLTRMILTSWSPSTRPRLRRWTWRRRRWRRGHVGLLESRQQIVAHRELINRPGDFDCVYLYVVLENAFVCIEVRVPSLGAVLNRVLAHADAGQTRLTE